MAIQVLVVDDNDDARDILSIILVDEGYRVTLATDGLDALRKVRADRPHLILMDIFMPHMDGITATKALKEDQDLARIPVIACTAKPQDVEERRHLFFDVLTKPCEPARLFAALELAWASREPLAESRRGG